MHYVWEHGLSENTSELLRQYFPKGTNDSTGVDNLVLEHNAAPDVGESERLRDRRYRIVVQWRDRHSLSV